MQVDQEWKARVDEVLRGGDLSKLFQAAGSPLGLDRDESIGRKDYLVSRLFNRSNNFADLARSTESGDLTELQSLNRTLTLVEVHDARIEHLAAVAATSSPRLAKDETARIEAEASEAFGGRSAWDAAHDASRRLQDLEDYQRAGQSAAGPEGAAASGAAAAFPAHAVFAGLGRVRPGGAASTAGADEVEAHGTKPPAYGKPRDPQGPVIGG